MEFTKDELQRITRALILYYLNVEKGETSYKDGITLFNGQFAQETSEKIKGKEEEENATLELIGKFMKMQTNK